MKTKSLTIKFYLPAVLLVLMVFTTSMVNRRLNAGGFSDAVFYGKDTDGDGVKDKKDKCPGTPQGVQVDETGCPLDNDKDGVADYIDKCPAEVGIVHMEGCPDKDNDGVADKDDACPNVPGIGRFKGCPDSDGDGIEDAMDHCPNAMGLDIFKGCPDADGDGVQDEFDKCANTRKGVKVDTRGCPSDLDGDGVFDLDDKCPTMKGMGTANGDALRSSLM
jgi:OmpA-OmpF porin, OOP family